MSRRVLRTASEGLRDPKNAGETDPPSDATQPNYPGRSSHLCNAGFVVPTVHRGLRVGSTLGRAYLHYGPQLGYRGSVFNLVYISNEASVRIWDALGFTRAGLIPGAGRLKRKDGQGEEYVDAIVYHKDFTASA